MRRILPYLFAPIYGLLSLTWRIREVGPPEVLSRFGYRDGAKEPCVYAHWHGDDLALVGYASFRGLCVLSSLSRDGALMARTLQLLGYRVYRGSSTRGGARGLIGLIRAVRKGSQAALAVDGPRGPIYEVKPGVVELALRTGMPIIAVRSRASRCWYIAGAWNRSYVPKPFARVEVEFDQPIYLEDAPDVDLFAVAAEVKKRLDALPGQPVPS